jgi:hypothetical protein
MALNDDVRHLILILDQEGFGAIAGNLMTELSLGRRVQALPDEGENIARQAFADEEQLDFAMEFLRLRLVVPVRAFAEAERIAGELSEDQTVKINLVDPIEGQIVEPISREKAGDAERADRLAEFLEKLPSLFTEPEVDG